MSDSLNAVTPLQSNDPQVSSISAADDISLDLALTAARAADERKGGDIRVLKVADVSYLADYFVVVTGFSAVQVRAIARTIEEAIKSELKREPLRTEGQLEGSWVLQDYGDVIVHIFMPEAREYYNLEAFWGHAEVVPFDVEEPS